MMVATDMGRILQQGYVVADAFAAARAWAERTGAGPFYLLDVVMNDYMHRGRPASVPLRIALGFWDDMQIELIQPMGEDDVYMPALRAAPGRLNHFATFVADLDGVLARRNLSDQILHAGRTEDGTRFVYLDRFMPGGEHLELIEPSNVVLEVVDRLQAIARCWDGHGPVRLMADLSISNAS